jgi:hypothetical protein
MILPRNVIKDTGMRQQEREVTYAQLQKQRIDTGGLEGTLQYILFEATSDWGMSPARPFWIMLSLIPMFGLFYMLPIARPSPKTGVRRVWDKDRGVRITATLNWPGSTAPAPALGSAPARYALNRICAEYTACRIGESHEGHAAGSDSPA